MRSVFIIGLLIYLFLLNDYSTKIAELGEPFFVVPNSNEVLMFGGHPWQYVACSHRSNEYSVCTLNHEKIATFPNNENSFVGFHPDDSGAIVHFHEKAVT